MLVTLGVVSLVVLIGARFVVVRHRKLDETLKSLGTCLKLD